MNLERRFHLRACKPSKTGTFFDVHVAGSDYPVATVAILPERPFTLQVVHPAVFYRSHGFISGSLEGDLFAWFFELAAVNLALREVGGAAVGQVSWNEAGSLPCSVTSANSCMSSVAPETSAAPPPLPG